MKRIEPDYDRRVQLAGVAAPVPRPVDIDQSQTGFASLRSLRIYCFIEGSVIDGHAEDDEVLIVVLAGSVQLQMSEFEIEEASPRFLLSAVDNPQGHPCVAYLPPNGAYRLIPQSDAEVAYARAKSSNPRVPRVFAAQISTQAIINASLVFEEASYSEHLRLRITQVTADKDPLTVSPVSLTESASEALVHVRTTPSKGAASILAFDSTQTALGSWDTVACMPGERWQLSVAPAASALIMVVLA